MLINHNSYSKVSIVAAWNAVDDKNNNIIIIYTHGGVHPKLWGKAV